VSITLKTLKWLLGRILGVDYGLKRIGLALSDPTHLIASKLTTLQAEKTVELTAKKLLEVIGEHDIEKIVI